MVEQDMTKTYKALILDYLVTRADDKTFTPEDAEPMLLDLVDAMVPVLEKYGYQMGGQPKGVEVDGVEG